MIMHKLVLFSSKDDVDMIEHLYMYIANCVGLNLRGNDGPNVQRLIADSQIGLHCSHGLLQVV